MVLQFDVNNYQEQCLTQLSSCQPQPQQSELSNKSASIYQKQYYQFFNNVIPDSKNYIPQTPSQQNFKRHKIKYLDGNQYKQNSKSFQEPYIRVKYKQRSANIVAYIVIVAKFELQITLLNIDINANKQQIRIGQGTFGSVRVQSQNNRMFAVKRQMFKNKYHLKEFDMMANKYEIQQVIKQLAIYKICSLFKIGPAAQTDIGFDLICYRDCIEFQIQLCQIIENKKGICVDTCKFQKQIKQCLFILHYCKIIHKDIKPLNILFSIKYNKYVLTDFGISHPVIEKIGQLSETILQGTDGYMSNQMKKIKEGQTGYIHLYGNDVYSLSMVLKKKMKNAIIRAGWKKQSKYQYEYLKLKYYCVKPESKMKQVQPYWKYMDNNKKQQLIQIVDKSMQYEKICSVYYYLSKIQYMSQRLKKLGMQSVSITEIKLSVPNHVTNQLYLRNILRVYGYSRQVKEILTDLKLIQQQGYRQTIKIIESYLKKQKRLNDRLALQNKLKQSDCPLQEIFKTYMKLLEIEFQSEQTQLMEIKFKSKKVQYVQKLLQLPYKRTKQQEIQQNIRIAIIIKQKKLFLNFQKSMETKDDQRDLIIRNRNLNNQVGDIYYQLGKYHIAKKFYIQQLDLNKLKYGDQHPKMAICYNKLGSVQYELGNYYFALNYFKKGLQISILVHGQQHFFIYQKYNNIALVYIMINQYEQALKYSFKSLKISNLYYGKIQKYLESAYHIIGVAYYNLKNYEKALKYYQISLILKENTYGKQHHTLANNYFNIGLVYNSMGLYQNAFRSLQKGLALSKNYHNQRHPEIAMAYAKIGMVYFNMNKYKALEYLKKSLQIDLGNFGYLHPNIAGYYNNLGAIYIQLKQYKKGQFCYDKSLDIYKKFYPENHTQLKIIENNLIICKSMLQKNKSIGQRYMDLDLILKTKKLDDPESFEKVYKLILLLHKLKKYTQSFLFYQVLINQICNHHNIQAQFKNVKLTLDKISKKIVCRHKCQSLNEFLYKIYKRFSKFSCAKLLKILYTIKSIIKFEQIYNTGHQQYIICQIKIFLCYKGLKYTNEINKSWNQIVQCLKIQLQTQKKQTIQRFLYEIR